MITQTLISEFLEEEIKAHSQESPRESIVFFSTKDITQDGSIHDSDVPGELKPLSRQKRLLLFFILLDIIGFSVSIYQFYISNLNLGIFFILLIVFILLLVIPLIFIMRLQKDLEVVKISKEGVATSQSKFTWEQLHDTFILKIPYGLDFKRYLVLVTREDKIFKFDLGLFLMNDFLLASFIERYKLG